MLLRDLLNQERVSALYVEPNAYVARTEYKPKGRNVMAQEVEKVVFPEPYENVSPRYSKHEFYKPEPPEPSNQNQPHQMPMPMFDIKSLLPMLMSGKFNDMLKPMMSLLGGGNSGNGGMGDIAKIFELFKPKSKSKPKQEKDEDISSKFDDMIIIED